MSKLPFKKQNYQLMIVGVLVVILGCILMASSRSPDGFGFIDITLSPIVIMSGFVIEFFAILYHPDKRNKKHK